MGKLSRVKGANFERIVAARFRVAGWPEAARTLTETRDGNCGDLVNVKPFSSQIKCGGAPSVWRALREAASAADPGDIPLAIVRRDRERPIAAFYLDDCMDLLGMLKRERIL